MRTTRFPALVALLAPLSFAAIGLAQEADETPQPERPKTALERTEELENAKATPQELFAAAVQRLRKKKDFVVRANVKHKQPEADNAQPGQPGQQVQIVVRAFGMGQQEDAFEGNVEAWRDDNGVAVVISEKAVPGFGLYVLPDKTIRRVTYDAKAPGLSQLQAELLSLLDGERFVRHVLAANLEHRVDAATGDHVWSGKIAREVVRPERAVSNNPALMMAMRMAPRVLRATVELRLTADGQLKQTRVTIVRNDPAREMMRGGIMGGRVVIRAVGGANWQVPQPEKKEGGDKEKHEIEGVSTIYTLDLTAKEASERAKAFKREMRRAAGE